MPPGISSLKQLTLRGDLQRDTRQRGIGEGRRWLGRLPSHGECALDVEPGLHRPRLPRLDAIQIEVVDQGRAGDRT